MGSQGIKEDGCSFGAVKSQVVPEEQQSLPPVILISKNAVFSGTRFYK